MRKILTYGLVIASFTFSTNALAGACDYANSTVSKMAGGGAGVTVLAGGVLKALGVSAVAHSSGAAIATGAGSYMAGTLGALGTVASVMTAPATLIIAGATATAVGGTLVYCYYSQDEPGSKTANANSVQTKPKSKR